MGGRRNIKLRCGAPLATRTCPDCSRLVHRERNPDGVCPGCGTRVEYRCPQPLTAVHPQCPLHPDNTPDALPMLERIANTLGSSNTAGDSARVAFLKAANTPPEEIHRLMTAWSMAAAMEAQHNVNLSAQDRFEYLLAATRAAERYHYMHQLTARDKSDWEFRKHALNPQPAEGNTAQVTAAVVRVQYRAVTGAAPTHILQAKAAAEKAFESLDDDDGVDP